MSDVDTVLMDVQEGVAVLTLNRPHRRNAWTVPMHQAYFARLAECDRRKDVRVVVVTGADGSFCPGADIEALEEYSRTGETNPEFEEILEPEWFPLLQRKPMLAAIEGMCAGIGLAQALMCDVRFVASDARITTAFVRRGLPAIHGMAWLLQRAVTPAVASELLISGRTFLGDEAAALGIAHRSLPPSTVLEHALGYAAEIAMYCAPRSIASVKSQLTQASNGDVASAVALSDELQKVAIRSSDLAEGLESLIQKRPPQFAALDAAEKLEVGTAGV